MLQSNNDSIITTINFDVEKYQSLLIDWQKSNGRNNLPWQKTFNPYSVWVSEIMLQQTQVKTVIEYFNRFISKFPDINSLASALEDEVMNYWAGLGYYARARNLHKAAKIVFFELNGVFPNTFEQLILLPGIGKSTANAILSICHGQAAPILDGNVKRIFSRVFAIDQPTSVKQVENLFWDISYKLMPQQKTQKYTQSLMDLGSLTCTRTKPSCNHCPIKTICLAFKQEKTHLYPIAKLKKKKPSKSTIFYLYLYMKKILLIKNQTNGIWGGLYSLPEEELPVKEPANTKIFLQNQKHIFTHFILNFDVMLITVKQTEKLTTMQNAQWVSLDNICQYALPAPIKKILLSLKNLNLNHF